MALKISILFGQVIIFLGAYPEQNSKIKIEEVLNSFSCKIICEIE